MTDTKIARQWISDRQATAKNVSTSSPFPHYCRVTSCQGGDSPLNTRTYASYFYYSRSVENSIYSRCLTVGGHRCPQSAHSTRNRPVPIPMPMRRPCISTTTAYPPNPSHIGSSIYLGRNGRPNVLAFYVINL